MRDAGPFALETIDRFEILLGRLVEMGVAGHRAYAIRPAGAEFRDRAKRSCSRALVAGRRERRVDRVAREAHQRVARRTSRRRTGTRRAATCRTTPGRRRRWSRCSPPRRARRAGGRAGRRGAGEPVRRRADFQRDPALREHRDGSGSSIARTPWPMRSARSTSTAARTLAGPAASPACATACRPPSRAIANARSNSSAGKRASSPPSPIPMTPRSRSASASRDRLLRALGTEVAGEVGDQRDLDGVRAG